MDVQGRPEVYNRRQSRAVSSGVEIEGDGMPENPTAELTPEENLALLTDAVWKQMGGHTDECPPEKIPTFRQLDDLISTTAWGAEARDGVLPSLGKGGERM